MPVPDPRVGNFFVWLVSCLFFLVIFAGGTFLLMYIALPETESTAWYPIAGVALVGIPWFFWFLTFLYRIVFHSSRPSGIISGGGGGGEGRGGGGGGGGGANAGPPIVDANGATTSDAANTDSPQVESPDGGARRVRFGATVVVGEQDGPRSSEHEGDGESHRTSTSSSVSNDEYTDMSSLASRESEMPLTLSMAS